MRAASRCRGELLGCLILAEAYAGPQRYDVSAVRVEGFHIVKKMLVLAVLGFGVFAVWRKVQADRAEIDLWTEATTAELN